MTDFLQSHSMFFFLLLKRFNELFPFLAIYLWKPISETLILHDAFPNMFSVKNNIILSENEEQNENVNRSCSSNVSDRAANSKRTLKKFFH